MNSLKNFYEKCYVKINENWRKKHTSTNNLSKKNDSIYWKLIWWKLDKIRLELVKNMGRFGKKKCGLGSCTLYTTYIYLRNRFLFVVFFFIFFPSSFFLQLALSCNITFQGELARKIYNRTLSYPTNLLWLSDTEGARKNFSRPRALLITIHCGKYS